MSLVNKYINSSDFLTATAVYDDIDLLIVSADGYYQFGGNYRQQLSGVLGPVILCGICLIPFSSSINQGSSVNCATVDQTYYFAQNVPDINTIPIVTNAVFSDSAGVSSLSDGNYVLSNNSIMTVVGGVVTAIINSCTALALQMSNSTSSSAIACGIVTFPIGVWTLYNSFLVGDTVYTDAALTIVFAGDGTWYNVQMTPTTTKAVQINAAGLILDAVTCP